MEHTPQRVLTIVLTPQRYICYSLALKYPSKARGSVLGLQLTVLLGGGKILSTGAEEEG